MHGMPLEHPCQWRTGPLLSGTQNIDFYSSGKLSSNAVLNFPTLHKCHPLGTPWGWGLIIPLAPADPNVCNQIYVLNRASQLCIRLQSYKTLTSKVIWGLEGSFQIQTPPNLSSPFLWGDLLAQPQLLIQLCNQLKHQRSLGQFKLLPFSYSYQFCQGCTLQNKIIGQILILCS